MLFHKGPVNADSPEQKQYVP